ncbi:MAG: hypothetical protein Q8P49_02740 [Candidatus Liptonbacteria bacterium]|nr:hypothetical protein [Candidatus Liptonbacteria bacterium]
MSLEKPETSYTRQTKTPDALIAKIKLLLDVNIGKIEVFGAEKLDKIPTDRKIIFASSHISDYDMPITASAVAEKAKLVFTNMSSHHKFSEAPADNINMRIAGKENYLPIKFKKDTEGGSRGEFDPKDYVAMEEALAEGSALLIAAHNPTGEWRLPDNGGYAAVYAALRSGALVVPVAVNIKSEKPIAMASTPIKNLIKRPDAEVRIGEPISLDGIERLGEFGEIIGKRRAGTSGLTQENIKTLSAVKNELRARSAIVMRRLAEMLPPEKRGRWDETSPPKK